MIAGISISEHFAKESSGVDRMTAGRGSQQGFGIGVCSLGFDFDGAGDFCSQNESQQHRGVAVSVSSACATGTQQHHPIGNPIRMLHKWTSKTCAIRRMLLLSAHRPRGVNIGRKKARSPPTRVDYP